MFKMKIARKWRVGVNNNNEYMIVKKEQKNYMPEHHGKGAVCINEHWVYRKEKIPTMIKRANKETEKEINILNEKKHKLYEEIKKINSLLQTTIKKGFKGAD